MSTPTGNINFERLKELGFTDDVREAGYITPQGRLIDLSGKREGGPAGTRSYDHREAGGTLGMQEFMAQGNIRLSMGDRTSPASVDMAKEPTTAQYDILRHIFELKHGNVLLDLNDGLGELGPGKDYYVDPPRSSFVGGENANATKLLGLVRKFYQGVDVSGTVLGTSFMVSGERTRFNPAGFIYHNTNSILLPEIAREGLAGGSFGARPVDFGGDVWLAVRPEDLRGTVETHQYGGVLAYEPVWDDPIEGAEVCPPIPPERIYLANKRGKILGRLLDAMPRSNPETLPFFRTCTDWPVPTFMPALRYLIDNGQEISRSTFLRNVDREAMAEWEDRLGYDPRGLHMSKDPYVSYYRLREFNIYWFDHSRIEHVFARPESIEALNEYATEKGY
jgi:hypothetical protein